MRTLTACLFVGVLAGCAASEVQSDPYALQSRLDAFIAEHSETPAVGIVIVDADGRKVASAAAGVVRVDVAAPTPFTASTPVRIASNTKTYAAGTAMRLWESGRIDLDSPIADHIDVDFRGLLESGGYDPTAITVRHLLSHSGGLFDHAATDEYFQMILADPTKEWTRRDQVALAVELGAPVGAPGERFSYSDTGYVLLGHIIERVTGKSLAAAVRSELQLDRLGLTETWWEITETPPGGVPPRAHQYAAGADTHDWHGSIDLYGGGGLMSSLSDMALFNAALFRGDIFERPETLAEMTSRTGPADPDRYRLGLQIGEVSGHATIGHSGFWGTIVLHVPDLNVTLAAAVTERGSFRSLRELVTEVVEALDAELR